MILAGDCREVLPTLDEASVHSCVTSPPYWGLRDYGEPGQLGLEPSPDAYVAALVEVFREVRRVLRRDGTLWLSIGDSYVSVGGLRKGLDYRDAAGLKQKDLIGIPWRLALALQADGWWLRSDIIWSKPNPMPEPVTDRPTSAHEYVFLLSKSERYAYDHEAVKEKALLGKDERATRNLRDVWEIPTEPRGGTHFAVFPRQLVRRCILASCPQWVCARCGQARERIVQKHVLGSARADSGNNVDRRDGGRKLTADRFSETLGWSDCGHDDYRPGVVLDPFLGSGTTAIVARELGRECVGIELSSEYCAHAQERLSQEQLEGIWG